MTQTKAELLQTRHQGDLKLGDADSTNYVGFKAPATVGSNLVWTLPATDGSANQFLQTNASGVLGWGTADVSSAMPLTGGTFTGDVTFDGATAGRDIVFDRSDNALEFADHAKATFGTGDDFYIASGGTGAKLHVNNGVLEIEGDSVQIWNSAASEAMAKFIADGAVELYHNNVKKFETSAAGIAITGAATISTNLTVTGDLTVSGTTTTINTQTLDVEDKNVVIGKVSSPSDTTADGGGWTLKGTTDKTFNWVNSTDAWTSSEHIHLGDSKKLLLGTDSDLEFFHDGSHANLINKTGNLYINSSATDTSIVCKPDGAVELNHNHIKKIETTSSGINVTGAIQVNGAALSTSPTITAVATGSIGANTAVQLNSNGTVSVVSRATPAIGTRREFNNAASSHIAACYNPTDKVVAVAYKTSSGGAVRFGTVSGDEITFSAATQWSSNPVEFISMAHDNKDNAYFIAYRNDDNGYGFVFALSANGTSYGTKSSNYTWTNNNAKGSSLVYAAFCEKIIFARINGTSLLVQTLSYNGSSNPTNGSAVSSESSASGAPSLCVDETNSKSYLSYYNSNLTEGFTRILTVSGTSITQTNAITWHTYAAYYVKTVYDTTNSKLIVTFTDGNDGEKSKVRAGTINHSNNQISWSNSVNIDGSSYSSYTAAAFNSDRGKIDYYGKDSNSYLYYVEIDASGTHPSCTTKVIIDNTTNNNWGSAIFDTNTLQSFHFYQGESSHGDYISKDSGASTLTAENFLGFSSAAYTNGQTATINVVGNTTTQSSLTPAQKYYIQLDGTLGLSPVTPSVEAGLALSSTKLLIK